MKAEPQINNLYMVCCRNALTLRNEANQKKKKIESNNEYRVTTGGLPFLFLANYNCIRNYWSPWTKFKELRYPSILRELIFHFVTTDLKLTFSLPALDPPRTLYNNCIACKCFQFFNVATQSNRPKQQCKMVNYQRFCSQKCIHTRLTYHRFQCWILFYFSWLLQFGRDLACATGGFHFDFNFDSSGKHKLQSAHLNAWHKPSRAQIVVLSNQKRPNAPLTF